MLGKNNNFKVIFSLCFVIIVDSIGISLVYPVLAPLFSIKTGGILPSTVTINMRDMLYGITMAIFPIFMFIGAPVVGELSDHFGRKKILLICLVGEAFGMLIAGISITISSLSLLLIARAFSGLMASNMPVARAAIIDISTDEDKIINISFTGLSDTLGFILGPLISGFLSDNTIAGWMGFSIPFYTAAILACINSIILVYTFKESFIAKGKKKINLFAGLVLFIAAFKHKEIKNLSIVYLLHTTAWTFYIAFITIFLVQKYNYSATHAGYFVSWIALILSIALLLIIRMAIKFFNAKQITLYSIIIIIFGVILAIHQTLIMQWISSVFIASGVGLVYSSMFTLFSNAVDKNKQGWIMGVVGAIVAVAGGIAGIMISIILPMSYIYSYYFMLIIWCIALIIYAISTFSLPK